MKIKRLLILAFASLFALIAPVSAASYPNTAGYEARGGVYCPQKLSFSMNAGSMVSETLSQNVYFSNFSSGSYNYYDQLNTMEKTVYNGLKKLTPTSGTIYIQFQYTDGVPNDSSVQAILSSAMDALLFDYPELFWLDLSSCKIEAYADDVYDPIVTIQFEPAVTSGFSVSNSGLEANLQSAENSISASGSSRYEKLKSIHDALARKVTYDYDAISYYDQHHTVTGSLMQSFTAYGALVNGKAVCEGYAEAFKLLCDKAGIPCIVVVGTGVVSASESGSHMWNAVKMEDGNWYDVDVTWDDQSYTVYDFFLAGSDSTAPAFTDLTFSQSHRADGEFTLYHYDNKLFTYPTISRTAYSPNGVTTTTEPSQEHITVPQPAPSVTVAKITQPSIAHTNPPPAATATGTIRATQPKQSDTTSQPSQTTTETLLEESDSTDVTEADSSESGENVTDSGTDTTSGSALAVSGDSRLGTIFIIGGVIIVAAAAGILVLLLIRKRHKDQTIGL